jgi:hypothetical protein
MQRTWWFCATSNRERIEWVDAIKASQLRSCLAFDSC